MPVPQGQITSSEGWTTPAQLENADIPFEKIEEPEEEVKEEE